MKNRIGRGVVGRRVHVRTACENAYEGSPTHRAGEATVTRVTKGGRYWLSKLVPVATAMKFKPLSAVQVKQLDGVDSRVREAYIERHINPPFVVRRRRVFSRCELRFLKGDYR